MAARNHIEDGGPAFARSGDEYAYGQQDGASLRDLFACHAPEPSENYVLMQMECDRAKNPHNDNYHNSHKIRSEIEIRAEFRFAYADAMLEARK